MDLKHSSALSGAPPSCYDSSTCFSTLTYILISKPDAYLFPPTDFMIGYCNESGLGIRWTFNKSLNSRAHVSHINYFALLRDIPYENRPDIRLFYPSTNHNGHDHNDP